MLSFRLRRINSVKFNENRVKVSLDYDKHRVNFTFQSCNNLISNKSSTLRLWRFTSINRSSPNKISQKIDVSQILVMFNYIGKARNHPCIVGQNINEDTFTSYLLHGYHKWPSGTWFDVHVMFYKAFITIFS